MAIYIGIDLGTSSVKLLAIDEHGKIVHQCQQDYTISQPQPGFKEIDPKQWINAVENGLAELLNPLDRDQVSGIGVTGQMHTTLFLDAAGESIRPALMWNDTRTTSCVKQLKDRLYDTDDTRLIQEILSTGSPAANLYWLKQNEPENFLAMRHFVIGPDYIVHYLTGKISTDYCEASTSSLYDIKTKTWSESMAKIIGIPCDVYPPIYGSGEIVGTIQSTLSKKFGLSKEVFVIAGTGDNPAAAIATGCLQGDFP
ncbi:MAG: FGGY family carbohydrate kinase, partial [Eubacterium sp.]